MVGGGRGGGSRPDPRRHELDCLTFSFETALELIPDAPMHESGTVLEVLREEVGHSVRIVAVDDDGEVVGVITSSYRTLLDCMEAGFAFVAVVRELTLMVHQVSVRAASRDHAERGYRVEDSAAASSHELKISDREEFDADVSAGRALLVRERICELRSLLRVGIEFDGIAESSDAVVARQR